MAEDEATMELLRRAGHGEREALDQLLGRHRVRLRQMIAVRMDVRLSARIDPSDVVQETFVEAAQKLPEYAGELRSPFYLGFDNWLGAHLVLDLSRKHISAGCRSVENQAEERPPLTEESAMHLAARLVASQTSPANACKGRSCGVGSERY